MTEPIWLMIRVDGHIQTPALEATQLTTYFEALGYTVQERPRPVTIIDGHACPNCGGDATQRLNLSVYTPGGGRPRARHTMCPHCVGDLLEGDYGSLVDRSAHRQFQFDSLPITAR